MNDNKTLIRSSIISLIIVILGLFTLCISRAPRINVDEPAAIDNGSSSKSDNVDLSDDNFFSLLDKASDEIDPTNDKESGSLSETETGSADQQTSSTDDKELAELFNLVNSDEASNSQSETTADSESDSFDQLLSSSETPSEADTESSNQESKSKVADILLNNDDRDNSAKNGQVTDLEAEISKLELALNSKNSEIESIHKSITDYDQKITNLEKSAPKKENTIHYAMYEPSGSDGNTTSKNEASSAGTTDEQYNVALDYFNKHDYKLAMMSFEQLLTELGHNNSLSDNCQYWMGECEFAQGKYYEAIVEFEKVFSYDVPDKKDDAQIMIGLAYMKLGQNNYAREDFNWLTACYQNSEYYKKAKQYISQL
jgi:TolA-binding protein